MACSDNDQTFFMNKLLLLSLLAIAAGTGATAQTTPPPARDTTSNASKMNPEFNDPGAVFVKVEMAPVFKGGDAAWRRFLQKNLQYPVDAIDKEMKGIVLVGFTVDEEGNVSGVDIISSPGKPLSKEAVRIIKLSSGSWDPAMQNGRKVKYFMKKPIEFRLSVN